MATTSDPRAAAFSAAKFRDAIRFTMNMGLPDDTAQRATFQWRPVNTYSPADPSAAPYSWTETPVTSVTHADVQIPVAVDFPTGASGRNFEINLMGSFENPYVQLTVLDVDYVLIAGPPRPSHVLLGQNTYVIRFIEPPVGLFEVTVYTIHCQAVDES